MGTLLLRMSGPMQSWGVSCKFNSRKTGREPTKSGVIGLVASAIGRRREDSIDDLNGLRFGVRIDQKGELLKDFHTVHTPSDVYITDRYYLTDAVFLVGLEGDDKLLTMIDNALKNPAFPLYLGRRSCPPAGKVSLGLRDSSLADSLRDEPWLASEWYRKKCDEDLYLETVCDAGPDDASVLERDVPITFNPIHRMYGTRDVAHNMQGVHVENASGRKRKNNISTDHDAISELKSNGGI
jgi:CRISPR system Cascade subunit CasD